MHPTLGKSEKRLEENLSQLGEKLKIWEGKEIQEIGDNIKETTESLKSTYTETDDPIYLLTYFVLQSMLTFLLSRRVFSDIIFKQEYQYDKEKLVGLGNRIIGLGEALKEGREKTLAELMKVLSYAYKNDLLMTFG